MANDLTDESNSFYVRCISKQLEEIDLLSSIFCNPGEIHIYDPNVISEFTEYVEGQSTELRSALDFSIYFTYNNEKIDIRIQLPHLYPSIENAKVILLTPLLSKLNERNAQIKIENFINSLDNNETYIYQVVIWIQDEIENLLTASTTDSSSLTTALENDTNKVENDNRAEVERLWIYSHHIKNKAKRREILHQAQNLNLTGFSKPGKPGIICVEGFKEDTQGFWKIIRSLRWQRITIKKSESRQKAIDKINEWRRFPDFREKLLTDDDLETESATEIIDMSQFFKFLEKHKSSYMIQEFFGFEQTSQ